MAIYHFSIQILSRKKQQNTIAAAAYRSGERLIDERTNEPKDYKRKVEPITHILAPVHAPQWVYNRQQLWNEMEKKEKQWNAQLAREMNIALPKELTHQEQEKLAIEFCEEVFVKDGMVADLSIHRDDEENPHFHVMLTMRPFQLDGTWGSKQVKVKEIVNGKQQVRGVHTTDWNTKEKLIYWRKQWANYANRALERNRCPERITHLSNTDRGLETLPTIHEGYIARQMQKEGKTSERVEINKERRAYNRVVVQLAEAKEEKRVKEKTEKFIRCFTPNEKKQLKEAAKDLRLFVNAENIRKRRMQLHKWQSRLELSQDSMDKLKKLNRIDKETEILHQAEGILEQEADRFLDTYYRNLNKAAFSKEQKIEIVEATVAQNKRLSSEEIEGVYRRAENKQLESDLYALLNNHPQFVLSLQQEIKHAGNKFEILRIQHGIDFANPDTIKNVSEKNVAKMQYLLQYKERLNQALDLMERLYNHQLQEMYPNWDGQHYLTLEQKEFFVMAEEYYGNTLMPEDFANPPRKYMKEDQENIIFSLYQLTNMHIDANTQNQHYEYLRNKYPDFQVDNHSFKNMFYYECIRYSDELGAERINQLYSAFDVRSFDGLEHPEFGKSSMVTTLPDHSNGVVNDTFDFFSILESAIREADRKWREDEFKQQKNKKKRHKGMER